MHKARSATSQQAYEASVAPLFAPPDRFEKMLAGKDFLVGGNLTEDVYLFIAIARFYSVSAGHFKPAPSAAATTRSTRE